MAPRDGSLVGMFRLLRGGKVAFVELLTISDAPSGPTLRIRHFDLGLAPSESTPLVYVAVSAAPATITFEHPTDPVRRLTFRRTPAGLSVTLDLRRGGSRVFTYAPMRPRLPRRP